MAESSVPVEALPIISVLRDNNIFYTALSNGSNDGQVSLEVLRASVLSEVDQIAQNFCNLQALLAPQAANETYAAFAARARAALEGAMLCLPATAGGQDYHVDFEALRAAVMPSGSELALAQVQSDWTEQDEDAAAYIKNKPAGAGVQFLNGDRDPVASDGREGDYWINNIAKTFWRKDPSGWTKIADFSGADGSVWITGPADPTPTTGADGNYYINTTAGTVWKKISGSWVLQFQFGGGINWHFVTDNPNNTPPTGAKVGDMALNTINGNLYRADSDGAGGITWTFIVDITGPQGTDGGQWASGTQDPNKRPDLEDDVTMYFRTLDGSVWQRNADGSSWTKIFTINAAPGTNFFVDSGDPNDNAAYAGKQEGDLYLDQDTSRLYRYQNNTWVFITTLKGDQGTAAEWHNGVGTPATSLGKDGDFYLKSADNTIWKKSAGIWTKVATINVSGGVIWSSGSSLPANSFGSDGDLFLLTTTGTIYKKVNGVWTKIIDLPGEDGTQWIIGTVIPTSTTTRSDGSAVQVGDLYLRSTNGYVYKWDGSTWEYQYNITGKPGRTPEVYTGGNTPPAGVGEKGDLFIGTDGTLWKHNGTTWVNTQVSLRGADGGYWYRGSGNPNDASPGFGREGDWYFRTGTEGGTIWRKGPSQWVEQINVNGLDGSFWHSGKNEPNNTTPGGKDGDMYYQTSNGHVWQKQNGAWKFLYDATGRAGTQFWTGTVHPKDDPQTASARVGDHYLRTTDSQLWIYTSKGQWEEDGSLQGADGATWYSGSAAPKADLGKNGDFFFQKPEGVVWKKDRGQWVIETDLKGSRWHRVTGVPGKNLGEVGDWAFNTTNGFCYEKTGTSTWVFRYDVTGKQGPEGENAVIADAPAIVFYHEIAGAWVPAGIQRAQVRWYKKNKEGEVRNVAYAWAEFRAPNANNQISVARERRSTTVTRVGASPITTEGVRSITYSYEGVRTTVQAVSVRDGAPGEAAINQPYVTPGYHIFPFIAAGTQTQIVEWRTPGATAANTYRRVRLTCRLTSLNAVPVLTTETIAGTLGTLTVGQRQNYGNRVNTWTLTVADVSMTAMCLEL